MGATALPRSVYANKADDTLRWSSDKELGSLDYFYDQTREGIILWQLIGDAFLYRDPKTFAYKPLLATAWSFPNDTTLEMTLRQGVMFHDGTRMRADDVVATLNAVIDPKNKVVRASNVDWIQGAEKISEYRVRVHMHKPFPPVLDYLAGPIVVYPKAYYERVGPDGMNAHPIGTGPYKFVHATAGKDVQLELNPNYFSGGPKGKPSIGKISFLMIPDKSTQIAQLLAGEVDWIWQVAADQMENLKANPAIATASGGSLRFGYLGYDVLGRGGKNPFQDARVRRAVAYAIDRQAIVRDLVKGSSKVIEAACHPAQVGCTTQGVTRYDFDPRKAKALLSEAGYPQGFSTDFYAYRDRPYAEAMINYLRDVGIIARLNYVQYPNYLQKTRGGGAPFFFGTWGSEGVNDVSGSTSYFFEFTPDDTVHDSQVRDALALGDRTMNKMDRLAAYRAALDRISQEAYWLPLFTWSVNYAFTKELNFIAPADELPRFFSSTWQ